MDDSSGHTGAWSRRQLQELQGLLEGYVSDHPKGKATDEGHRTRFRVTIDLLISDKRKRDPDGAINTISVREIQEIVVRVRRAPKGNEGAIVTLEKMEN